MHGISPRYIQDKISNALVAHPDEDSVNPFMVLHELEAGLRHHSLITSQEQLQHYRELLAVVRRSTRTSSRTRCSGPSPPTRTP